MPLKEIVEEFQQVKDFMKEMRERPVRPLSQRPARPVKTTEDKSDNYAEDLAEFRHTFDFFVYYSLDNLSTKRFRLVSQLWSGFHIASHQHASALQNNWCAAIVA